MRIKQTLQQLRQPHAIASLVLIIFSLLGLAGILNHAMWRDELNVWLIVRDSTSWANYVYNIRYEGHPLLWYLSLSFWNLFTDNPVIMQLWHWSLGVTVIALFWRYSPFARWQKVCFTFSYYPFYEYLLISRNYALGVVCLFVFCALFPHRKKSYWPLAIALALMANTNAYALLIAFGLVLMLIIEVVSNRTLSQAKPWESVLSLIIVGLGFAIAIYILRPPPDSYLQGGISNWNFIWSWEQFWRSLSRVWSAYAVVLIPADSKVFDTTLFGIISLLMLLTVSLGLWRKPLPLFFYLFASSEIVFFTYVKFLGSLRHYGHLWFILIAAIWLSWYYQPIQTQIPLRPLHQTEKLLTKHKKHLIGLFLVLQLIGGLIAYGRDWSYPFSASKATAQYIQDQGLNGKFIIGSEDLAMAPLSGYLNRKLYYPEQQALGSFTLFNQDRQTVTSEQILNQTQQILATQELETILVLNTPLQIEPDSLIIEPLAEFERALIFNEKYYLYHVTLKSQH
ncbi:MAG: hypothetical protein F6J87_10540 [Spirulina sp. SIO3F2]|nr:hypothetical protein [Spirulina sp. SIO3F2]